MIIGIAGKKQNGKDTVAKIIQYLTTTVKHSYHFTDFINPNINYAIDSVDNLGSKWEVHYFADKLKDIVCLLFRCTREQLESEEFKNSKLDNIWERSIDVPSESKEIGLFYAISGGTGLYKRIKYVPTYREILQYIATDLFRNQFHNNTWVNATMVDYKPLNSYNELRSIEDGKEIELKYPNWIIPDVRFPNEVDAIKEHNGVIIRVQRKLYHWKRKDGSKFSTTTPFVEHEDGLESTIDNHKSEVALDGYDGYDYIIDNNGTIEELIEKVKRILIKENII